MHHLTSPLIFTPFRTGSFLITGKELGDPSISRYDYEFFLLEVCKRYCLSLKSAKCE
jgi:hypothetical protein